MSNSRFFGDDFGDDNILNQVNQEVLEASVCPNLKGSNIFPLITGSDGLFSDALNSESEELTLIEQEILKNRQEPESKAH